MSTKSVALAVMACMMFSAISCIVQPQTPASAPMPKVVPPPVVVQPVPPPPPMPPPLMPSQHPVRMRGPLEMFADVRVGMPRQEVETMLGRPMVAEVERSGIVEAWYLPPPAVVKPGVPRGGPGAIFIAYRGGRVVEKRLNPQM